MFSQKRTFAFIFILVLACLIPATATAAEQTQDGLTLSVVTDKTAYVAGDTITGYALLENGSDVAVEDVSLAVDLPNAVGFISSETSKTQTSFAPGDSMRIDFSALIATDDDGGNGGGGSTGGGGNGAGSGTSNNGNVSDKGTGSGQVSTSDSIAPVLMGMGILALAGATAFFVRNRKARTSGVKIAGGMGLVALVVVATVAIPLAVNAEPVETLASPSDMSVAQPITVKGVAYVIGATAEYTIPDPEPVFQDIVFTKVASDIDETLEDAVFVLEDSSGAFVSSKFSDANGVVAFPNVPGGTYTLRESFARGYVTDGMSHPVVVSASGVTIDGVSTSGFEWGNTPDWPRTPAPVVNPYTAGDSLITGTGVAQSAQLVVIWPNGARSSAPTSSTSWGIPVTPNAGTLSPGEIITVYQERLDGDYLRSKKVYITVQAP